MKLKRWHLLFCVQIHTRSSLLFLFGVSQKDFKRRISFLITFIKLGVKQLGYFKDLELPPLTPIQGWGFMTKST